VLFPTGHIERAANLPVLPRTSAPPSWLTKPAAAKPPPWLTWSCTSTTPLESATSGVMSCDICQGAYPLGSNTDQHMIVSLNLISKTTMPTSYDPMLIENTGMSQRHRVLGNLQFQIPLLEVSKDQFCSWFKIPNKHDMEDISCRQTPGEQQSPAPPCISNGRVRQKKAFVLPCALFSFRF